ncbi:P-loop nucleotide/nucleoside kinase family protein [Kineosporia succinea]|uniref:Kinase n=1 Tax=Kineosporia succinea TaxID=84632 RepID=A0ABT9PDE9_9ACTN|nr:ATP-binding protein [Kineosporia succinea]MDP9830743.1 putative kinase [Kineosporia succinea]
MTARVVLTCGLAGSGKSTYARRLESEGWLRLSVDVAAWELGHTEHPLPQAVRDPIVARQREQLVEAVRAGRDVVVDYAFWSRAMRDEYRALARGAAVEVVYFDVPRAELLRRLASRTAGPDGVRVSPELLDRFRAGFEAPASDETDVRTVRA